jgi:omega-6 fatty acid desaturase (delta-12 desaturase)
MFTQREILSEMKKYIRVSSAHGALLFVTDVLMYVVLIYGVLYLPLLWMKCIASIAAGFKISNLVTIAHDAAHNSLTKSRLLNKFIAVTSLLPGLMNYRLWVYNHHQLHHPLTNIRYPGEIPLDNYMPYSKQEYDALSRFDQFKERFYRMPTFLGFGFYFCIERWFGVMLFPRWHMPHAVHASSWRHFSLILAYCVTYGGLLILVSLHNVMDPLLALVLGLVTPFFVFQCLLGFTVYVQHTHERVPWYKESAAGGKSSRAYRRQEQVSVHLTFPKWVVPLMQMHHAYDHGAHHVCPAIPCYQLGPAQERLNEMLGDKAVRQKFSVRWLIKTMNRCKLYDYENHRWLDFDGKPTTLPQVPNIEYANVA